MTAHTQPSPEAVGLVSAAIRKNDDASEALFRYIQKMEAEVARLTNALLTVAA